MATLHAYDIKVSQLISVRCITLTPTILYVFISCCSCSWNSLYCAAYCVLTITDMHADVCDLLILVFPRLLVVLHMWTVLCCRGKQQMYIHVEYSSRER